MATRRKLLAAAFFPPRLLDELRSCRRGAKSAAAGSGGQSLVKRMPAVRASREHGTGTPRSRRKAGLVAQHFGVSARAIRGGAGAISDLGGARRYSGRAETGPLSRARAVSIRASKGATAGVYAWNSAGLFSLCSRASSPRGKSAL
ncbi:hypothetical protein PHYPSEUDO_004123 [Phytophthora pseudosyringae]|uniref:Uncharacterized protein n=1 Tax=Phytophthora pseudosyringae TaxID=221518 RepID=A0A8T1WEK3_9STRA|nr:hypothetical protein PHYPSEUDO_004123 [Phytophthora pseudosyringae]